MKKQILILMMSLFALSVMAEKTKKEVTFNVPMTCENCVSKIEKNIAFEKGVKDLSCDLEAKTVKVTYLAEKTDVEKLQKGFEKIGYTASVANKQCCSEKKCEDKCHDNKVEKQCEGHCHDKKAEAKSKCCTEKKDECHKNEKQCTTKKSSCCTK